MGRWGWMALVKGKDGGGFFIYFFTFSQTYWQILFVFIFVKIHKQASITFKDLLTTAMENDQIYFLPVISILKSFYIHNEYNDDL